MRKQGKQQKLANLQLRWAARAGLPMVVPPVPSQEPRIVVPSDRTGKQIISL